MSRTSTPRRRSYSHLVSSLLDADEIGDVEPWMSPGAAAQRPPRLLLTLLGDYWWQHTESLPSAAIVALLAEFGVSDSAARAALSRLTRNGLLVTSKTRRRTFSRLRSRAARATSSAAARQASRGTGCGRWSRSPSPKTTAPHGTRCASSCAGAASRR